MDSKQKVLNQLRPKPYIIYGIFDFREKRLIYVSLDLEEVELQFDLEDYDENYDVISFNMLIT